jgi:hypothetical protein
MSETALGEEYVLDEVAAPVPPPPKITEVIRVGRKAKVTVALPPNNSEGDPITFTQVELFIATASIAGKSPDELRAAQVPCVTAPVEATMLSVVMNLEGLPYGTKIFLAPAGVVAD